MNALVIIDESALDLSVLPSSPALDLGMRHAFSCDVTNADDKIRASRQR